VKATSIANRPRMATLTLLVGLLGAIALPCAAHAQSSQFKGWPAVAHELSTRLAPPGQELALDQFIPAEGLNELLGTWDSFGGEHNFTNGSPNAVNMVIWRVVLSGFARGVAESCETPRLAFQTRFLGTLKRLCGWPNPDAKSEGVMQDFWFGVMGYNAPETEYRAWRDFFLTSSYRDSSARETIDAMTLAITMNPYFLLHR
jgi:hypothetical protein